MLPQTILFASSEPSPSSKPLEPVLAAWPLGAAPPASRCTITQLLAVLDHLQDRRAEVEPPTCVLLRIARADDAADADRCVQDLTAHGVPVLVLAEDEPRWRLLAERGICVLPWTAPPPITAAMLSALWQRQTYVRAMSRELALALRCQAGIRTEIERIHEELQLAANFQQEFTACPMPRLPGLDFAALFRPVSAVSGDIYCVRSNGPDSASFFIADAVGHGVPAALLTMVLTNSLIAADDASRENARPAQPGEVLARLNRRLIEGSLGNGRFATALYGTINAATREVTLAGAGHPPPLVLSRSAVRRIQTDGPLLGVFPDAEFTCATTTLAPGETLILHTDGLEAAFLPEDRRQQPYIAELREAFRAHDLTARDALADLELLIDEQYGSLHQQDDVTVVAIRATPSPLAKAA
ncbi:MAG: PP2C family protein-serine/threonine phosphatase [Phycisphaerales bacterium]